MPAHWRLAKIKDPEVPGRPAYTNTTYPFELTPPQAPQANPTSWYSTTVNVGGLTGGHGNRIVLRFEGVESSYRVWVNGQWVGQAMGSRLIHEFDVTDSVLEGANDLVVLVHQFSAGSYLEDQDQWWLPGIFRSVTLLAQRRGEVDDAEFRGHWDPVAGTAELRAEVTADSCAYPVTFEVYPLDADVSPQPLVAGVLEDQHRVVVPVDGARPWSPEEPNLYQVCIRSNMGCSAQFTVGFTDVTIGDDGVLCANGHALRFRGVNRHEFHPTRGRAVTEQDTVADYTTMLGHHINVSPRVWWRL